MDAQPEAPAPPAAPPPPMDEGIDLLTQAFTEASSKGLVVLAAKIAGGTARILGQNQRIAQLTFETKVAEEQMLNYRSACDRAEGKVVGLQGEVTLLAAQLEQAKAGRPCNCCADGCTDLGCRCKPVYGEEPAAETTSEAPPG